MKKLIVLAVVLALAVFAFAACTDEKANKDDTDTTSNPPLSTVGKDASDTAETTGPDTGTPMTGDDSDTPSDDGTTGSKDGGSGEASGDSGNGPGGDSSDPAASEKSGDGTSKSQSDDAELQTVTEDLGADTKNGTAPVDDPEIIDIPIDSDQGEWLP